MTEPIARLEAELEKVGAEHEPPAGWQTRVLAAVEQSAAPRRRWIWFAVPALGIAAAIALVLALRSPAEPQPLALVVSLDSGGPIVRGTIAKVGDVVQARATGGRARAVWIYRDDRELVVACPGPTGCRDAGDALVAEARLRAPGRYTVVALDAPQALPPPSGSLDADLAAAKTAGARSQTETIEVR